MWESQVLKERENVVRLEARLEARLEERRSALLKALRVRFQAEVPADLLQRIEQMVNLEVLARWFDASLREPSLEAFRATVQAGPTPAPTDN